MPQMPRTKNAISHAIKESRNLCHNYIGIEHLLLGLLREHEGVATQVLVNMGLTLRKVSFEVLHGLGSDQTVHHRAFRYAVDEELREAEDLSEAMKRGRSKVSGSAFEEITASLIDHVAQGRTLSDALAKLPMCSMSV